jgi:hypothetical protein
MVGMATATLTGFPLRFAVAMAEGLAEEITWAPSIMNPKRMCMWTDNHGCYDPDQDWGIGGPLIEQHKVWLSPPVDDVEPTGWDAEIYGADDGAPVADQDGCQTALIAICRAVVQAKLGETVSVPAELVEASA